MKPLAILAAALVALALLGRSRGRTLGPAPDDIDWLAEYRTGNSWTFPYRTASEWRD